MTPVISIKNLQKSYGAQLVLRGINLEVEAGNIIGYIGPNGAGKSTTIKILTGIMPEFEGSAEVLGIDVRKNPLEVKRRIGFIPENAMLYESLTPMEYLTFIGQLHQMPNTEIQQKAKDLLAVFNLADNVDNRMTTFSKGMRQKVLLIAGMIHNPEVIFLDEPLSGLDANSVILVKEILTQLKQAGKTIFYSSHIMDVVEKISDSIVIIAKGEVIANGTFEELNSATHKGSLEQLFSQLTGDDKSGETASQFINVLKN
jgi:ABC-2 type transport system ATP-binding protein